MRLALDTNILAYAEGIGDASRCEAAIALVERLPGEAVVLPAQTLGELYCVLTRKGGRAPPSAREAVLQWADTFVVADSSWHAFQSAFDLATDHQLQMWDSLIMSVAAETRCRWLISEDLQSGFTWRGLTVLDPFLNPLPSALEAVLLP